LYNAVPLLLLAHRLKVPRLVGACVDMLVSQYSDVVTDEDLSEQIDQLPESLRQALQDRLHSFVF